ncbi:MAG: helix-turn-helix domain-containing protein, partial [Chloroflexi bacterium]|nr:helix-turn-helix domain-containing protein [Chloroflexota bacterium]
MEMKSFGVRLRELRQEAGLSQRQLAQEVGVDFTYISKIENGKMPPPSRKVIVRLAEVLQTDKDELLTLAGETPSDIVEILKDRETLQLLREQARKKTTASRRKIGVATMNFKKLARVAIAVTLVVVTGTSLWFAGPNPVRAFNVAMSVASSPISSNATHLLGERVTIPATIQFNALENVNFQSVSINITGPEPFSKDLPIVAGTYNYSLNEGVPGNLNVVVGLTGTATTGLGGYGYGYGSGGSSSGNLTYTIKWTPPYALTNPPPLPPPALPGAQPAFTLSVPDEVYWAISPNVYYPQGLAYDGTNLYTLVPAAVPAGMSFKDAIIKTDINGNYISYFAAPGDSWTTEALTMVGSTLYAGYNYWDNESFTYKGKVAKYVSGNWTDIVGLSTLNTIGGLASDGTNLFIAYRDSPLKIEKRNPSSGALITTFDLSTAWGGGFGGPPIWGFDALAYDDSQLYAAQGEMIIKVDASTGAKTMEWKTGKWGIRGLDFVPYNGGATKVLYQAVTDGNVYTSSKEGNVPVVENTPIGNYNAQFRVVTNGGIFTRNASFTLGKLSTAPTVKIASPSPNFVRGAGQEDITVSGSINDPSITSITVGIALPEVTAFQDDVENASQSNAKWQHSSVAGINTWGPPYSTEDLWHRSGIKSHAGGSSWRYANSSAGNYDTGMQANAGALATKSPTTIGTDNKLSFWTWYDTEWDFWPDRKLVEISTDNISWQKIAWLAKFYPPFPPPDISQQDWAAVKKVEDRLWTKVEVPLAAFAGQDVYLRFRFDTMDNIGNMGEGWYIDDVSITGAGFLGQTVSIDDNLQFSTTFTLVEGDNVITARATRQNYSPMLAGEASVSGSLDLTSPVLTLNAVTTPTNQQYQTISGNVTEVNFDRLELKVNGQPKWSTSVLTNGTFSQPILLSEGDNVIFIEARDKLGQTDNKSATIKLDTTGPTFQAVFPGSDNRSYDVAYMTGETSARPGDFFFIALKVMDAASNIASVTLTTPGGGPGVPAMQKSELPDAVIDSWSIKANTKQQMNYVIPMQLPAGLPAGTYNWTVRARDAAGNESTLVVPTRIVTSLEAINVYLMPDWNLISLPLIPTTDNITTLTADLTASGLFEKIWYYDASQAGIPSAWKFYEPGVGGDLTTLGPGKGYWVKMKNTANFTAAGKVSGPMAAGLPDTPAPVKLTVAGVVLMPQQVPPTYTTYAGWNLIGLHAEYARDINTALGGLTYPQRIWASLLEYQNYIFFPMEEGD